MQALVPTSTLSYFILLLSTLLTPAILHIHLFLHTCRCSLDSATVSTPYVLAGTIQESRTFLQIFLSIITPSTLLHALAPACILCHTSTSSRPFCVTHPPPHARSVSHIHLLTPVLCHTSTSSRPFSVTHPPPHARCVSHIHLLTPVVCHTSTSSRPFCVTHPPPHARSQICFHQDTQH